jgi:hypothetical protein
MSSTRLYKDPLRLIPIPPKRLHRVNCDTLVESAIHKVSLERNLAADALSPHDAVDVSFQLGVCASQGATGRIFTDGLDILRVNLDFDDC